MDKFACEKVRRKNFPLRYSHVLLLLCPSIHPSVHRMQLVLRNEPGSFYLFRNYAYISNDLHKRGLAAKTTSPVNGHRMNGWMGRGYWGRTQVSFRWASSDPTPQLYNWTVNIYAFPGRQSRIETRILNRWFQAVSCSVLIIARGW